MADKPTIGGSRAVSAIRAGKGNTSIATGLYAAI